MPRAAEIALAVLLLALLSPLLVVVAVVNRILNGRVLFRQIRIGRGLAPFVILKFQTMSPAPPGATTVAGAERSRVVPFGRLLRALKIDEMPQLVNVLRGEMSLVGPRALTPNEIERVPPEVAAAVYALRPGMTGVASLVFSDEERQVQRDADPEAHYFREILPRKMAFEAAYARRRSLGFDLLLLGLTPLAVVRPAAARALTLRLIGPQRVTPGAGAGPVSSAGVSDG